MLKKNNTFELFTDTTGKHLGHLTLCLSQFEQTCYATYRKLLRLMTDKSTWEGT